MTAKKKGMGARENSSITLPQRVKLIDWLRDHKEDSRSYDEMAEQATRELGFVVTGHCMGYTRVAVHGRRNKETPKRSDLEARIRALENGYRELKGRILDI